MFAQTCSSSWIKSKYCIRASFEIGDDSTTNGTAANRHALPVDSPTSRSCSERPITCRSALSAVAFLFLAMAASRCGRQERREPAEGSADLAEARDRELPGLGEV